MLRNLSLGTPLIFCRYFTSPTFLRSSLLTVISPSHMLKMQRKKTTEKSYNKFIISNIKMFYTSIKIEYTQQTACHMSFDLKQVIQTYMYAIFVVSIIMLVSGYNNIILLPNCTMLYYVFSGPLSLCAYVPEIKFNNINNNNIWPHNITRFRLCFG